MPKHGQGVSAAVPPKGLEEMPGGAARQYSKYASGTAVTSKKRANESVGRHRGDRAPAAQLKRWELVSSSSVAVDVEALRAAPTEARPAVAESNQPNKRALIESLSCRKP
jgi:hypothetical protein